MKQFHLGTCSIILSA